MKGKKYGRSALIKLSSLEINVLNYNTASLDAVRTRTHSI